jgi:hypothetical protein
VSERRNTEPPAGRPRAGGAQRAGVGGGSEPPEPADRGGSAEPAVTPELVARVEAGELPHEALVRAGLARLRPRCRGCRETGRSLATALRSRGGRFGNDPEVYSAAHAGLADPARLLAGERRRAARELARLKALSWEERWARVRRGNSRYRRPALVDTVIAEGRTHLPADPQKAHHWFDYACEMALRLYGSGHADGVVA